MSIYFKDFPVVKYDLFRTGNLIDMTNITKRFRILNDVLDNSKLYYDYEIKEGQRPDIVSHILYNSVDYDWLILMVNQKLDPYYSWSLTNDVFEKYLEEKYGSVPTSMQTVHSYNFIERAFERFSDGTVVDEKLLVVDQTYYNTLPANQRKIIYAYDYEFKKNEDRRKIKVLDPAFIPQIDREKENIFK